MKPLSSLKILDFTRVLSGPYCTPRLVRMLLRLSRLLATIIGILGRLLVIIKSALFETVNRGKRSLVFDLGRQDDRAVALKLGAQADVVVENFKPGVADKLGVGFAALSAINPKLIYASISGFGQSGPLVWQARL